MQYSHTTLIVEYADRLIFSWEGTEAILKQDCREAWDLVQQLAQNGSQISDIVRRNLRDPGHNEQTQIVTFWWIIHKQAPNGVSIRDQFFTAQWLVKFSSLDPLTCSVKAHEMYSFESGKVKTPVVFRPMTMQAHYALKNLKTG